MAFAENASFKSSGVICLPPLPSTLLEELLMDRRNSSEFFLRRRVCTLSDSFCRTTDLSQFSVNELLSFLAWLMHKLAGLTQVVTLHIAQLHTVCILVVTPVLIVPCTLLLAVGCLPWPANLANNKLSKRRVFCTIVLH